MLDINVNWQIPAIVVVLLLVIFLVLALAQSSSSTSYAPRGSARDTLPGQLPVTLVLDRGQCSTDPQSFAGSALVYPVLGNVLGHLASDGQFYSDDVYESSVNVPPLAKMCADDASKEQTWATASASTPPCALNGSSVSVQVSAGSASSSASSSSNIEIKTPAMVVSTGKVGAGSWLVAQSVVDSSDSSNIIDTSLQALPLFPGAKIEMNRIHMRLAYLPSILGSDNTLKTVSPIIHATVQVVDSATQKPIGGPKVLAKNVSANTVTAYVPLTTGGSPNVRLDFRLQLVDNVVAVASIVNVATSTTRISTAIFDNMPWMVQSSSVAQHIVLVNESPLYAESG